ncbi:hypothetical protein A2U01_0082207, partial [Trifolium medium]|nr:hypothetical protein [Trifolium medium]
MTKARICDEDGKAKSSYYKALNDRKGKGQDRGKPYDNKGNGSGVRKQGVICLMTARTRMISALTVE